MNDVSAIFALIEKHTPKAPAPNRRVGLSPDRVRELLSGCVTTGSGLPAQPNPDRLPSVMHRGIEYRDYGNGYLRSRRVDGYKLLHWVVWEERNGPVPPGCIIGFIDRNKGNCAPENLICAPKKEMKARVAGLRKRQPTRSPYEPAA